MIGQKVPHLAAVLVAVWIAGALAWCARLSAFAIGAAVVGYALAGATLGGAAAGQALAPAIRTLLDRELGGFALTSLGPPGRHEPMTIRARLVEDAAPTEFGASARVEVEAVAVNGIVRPAAGGVRIAITGAAATSRTTAWRAGRVIAVPVTFRRPPRYLNAGVPDFERDLALGGIALNATAKSGLLVQVVRNGSRFEETAADLRAYVRKRLARFVGARDPLAAAIVTAIVIGDRTGLSDEVRARLQAAGTYHVIAISGGNIAILAALIAGAFLLTGLTGRASALAIISGLLGYAALVNAGPSVWRATATAVVYLSARLLDHRSPPWNAMAVSALLLACVAPLGVRDVGFALTFGATAAILEAARRVRREPSRRGATVVSSCPSWILTGVAASFAAEAALLPIGASAFSRVTFAGLVLNLVAVPLMAITQVAGLVVVLAGGIAWIGTVAGLVAAMAARALVESARLVDLLPWLVVRVAAPSAVIIVAYYAALAAAVWLPAVRAAQRLRAAIPLSILALVILTGRAPQVRPGPHDGRTRLIVFDVGQGDAMVLQTAAGRALMIDTGGIGVDGPGFDIGGRVLAPALWAQGVRRLEALALTHGDPDHIGGAASIIRDFAPAALWEGIPVPRYSPLRVVRSRASDQGVRLQQLGAENSLQLEELSIRILNPPLPDWERQRVRNDDSLVLEVRRGDIVMLLTGDISADVERAIVPRLTPARIRILKVAHHGSRTSTSQELIDAWKPQIAVISCGRGNRFGHPTPEVLERLRVGAIRVYRTDRDGQITVATDGRELTVTTFAEGNHEPRRSR